MDYLKYLNHDEPDEPTWPTYKPPKPNFSTLPDYTTGLMTRPKPSPSEALAAKLLTYTPPEPIEIPKPDYHPLEHRVKCWLHVANPVEGTCRCCGHRGYVNNPVIGLL
jgi:hypothetical protein